MTRQILSLFICFVLLVFTSNSQSSYLSDQMEVYWGDDHGLVMHAEELLSDKWCDLPQTQFWKKIMSLSPDSMVLNVASTRQILGVIKVSEYHRMSQVEKDQLRIDLRLTNNIESSERIFATTGKNDFYKFKKVFPTIELGMDVFETQNVDPWFAQAILLIESPGQMKKSRSGAYGAFQLMPAVARTQGLTVNRYTDEREDFEKSAAGAAGLIRSVCIPEAKKILDAKEITYNETDLWFRLFVLHVYHAGAGNVSAVVNKIDPQVGGQELIKDMWQNKAASFGNNSQNYSQLALASQLYLSELINTEGGLVYYCKFP
ncbi:MAG: hypothetical protein ACI9G9_001452 [Psychromonas sp.]|jgi:hypothetical protein